MIFNRKKRQAEEEKQPAASLIFDDFDYNDTVESITAGLPGTESAESKTADPVETETDETDLLESENSDTPEEALRKQSLLRRRKMQEAEAELEKKQQHVRNPLPDFSNKKRRRSRSELPEEREKREERSDPNRALPTRLRWILTIIVTIPIVFVMACMGLSQISLLGEGTRELTGIPGAIVTQLLAPVQNTVGWVSNTFSDYLATLKLRGNIETAYNEVVAENEELTYRAMLADELQNQLSQFETIYDEVSANTSMNPLVCTVIGRSDGNYFSTFTINRGARDGVAQYMAVTSNGALIGYTETVNETSSSVRSIIDSEASIAGLIQSSRDQGTVRGTLGVDGTALCRMYYLPDDSLPRPGDTVVTSGVGMSFPKGIPIGSVRESTRGMESNKSYVVVKPTADFEHIEYVVVLRYQPAALAVQASSNVSSYIDLVPVDTPRPYPTLRIGSASFYSSTATPVPEDVEITPAPTEEPTPSPTPEPTATPESTPEDTTPVLEYHVVTPEPDGPTPEPTASPTPEPTPLRTFGLDDLTLEEE